MLDFAVDSVLVILYPSSLLSLFCFDGFEGFFFVVLDIALMVVRSVLFFHDDPLWLRLIHLHQIDSTVALRQKPGHLGQETHWLLLWIVTLYS